MTKRPKTTRTDKKLNQLSSFQKKIEKFFYKNSDIPYNYKQVCHQIGINNQSKRKTIMKLLDEMVLSGFLLETDRGKYRLKQQATYVIGIVDMTSSGAAYIISESVTEDIYVPAKFLNHALPDDTVKVKLRNQKSAKRPEGEVTEIVERYKTSFIGTLDISKRFAFLIPDNPRMNVDIFIPLRHLNGGIKGQKVIVEITDWPEDSKSPFGKVVEVLGESGEHEVEMQAILYEYDFPIRFSKQVEEEAKKVPFDIPDLEIEKRKDFRGTTTFTIDPFNAKDFDDAVSVKLIREDETNGVVWEIGVHIADVCYYVLPGSILDKEAYERATSVYLVDRCIPMLPEHLSNGVCSLRPNEDKLCFSAVFEMNEKAEILNEWFGKTIINSNRRFTYEEAQEIIEKKEGEFSKEILLAHELSQKLRKQRFKKGSIDFDRVEVMFYIDDKGKPTGVYIKESKEAHKLIEDFMLLANRKVAEFIGKSNTGDKPKTFVYRVHDLPDPDKLDAFNQFINRFGHKINTGKPKEISSSINELIKKVKGKEEENIVSTLAIRSMSKAEYTTENIGHYGLAFEHYTHFTSPIRRYPDVMVHRLLMDYLDGKTNVNQEAIEKACKHATDMEIKAANAERDSIKLKQVEFMMDKKDQVFEGVVSGVTEWGIYVEIKENKCEGMVRLKDLTDDFYSYNDKEFCVVGKKYGNKYSLGDEVMVRVKRADLKKRQLDMELI